MNQATILEYGYRCPIRGCPKRNNRRFRSVGALVQHMAAIHGEGEIATRLRTSKHARSVVQD